MMCNVMIVEDNPMARKLLEILLEKSGKYQLVQSIENADMAELYCLNNQIDMILMDVCTSMESDGLDASARIKEKYPHVKIIVITGYPECSFVERARKAGVDSFWYKNYDAEKILSVMDRTLMGEKIYPEFIPSIRLGTAFGEEFTNREIEVLREVVAGRTDSAIAENLKISLRTVKAYIQNMRDKTGFRNRTELAIRARESGFVIVNHKTES